MSKKQTVLITALLVCIVFALGVIVGNSLTLDDAAISKFIRQSELNSESFLIEQDLFQEFETRCPLAEERLAALSSDLWKLGKLLETPDSKTTLGEETFDYLKRKYHLLQIRAYTLHYKLSKDCSGAANVILYYFKKQDAASQQQGQILDELVNEYDLHIFAIEHNYSPELSFLEEYYDVKQAPTIIVNFQQKLTSLSNKEQIKAVLK
ncbi:hypothetical protein COV18_03935 [Candidatus Woesearchaeota archaeon CG10_big_fil_rev_8_21_14_0_10_37_12]|nr:MAG: hypothetical protein COV18_03935 [Candidatus Woesearchaeota archaeon CG10_big_fil_rev_8_21_14_0_10_37_12]